MADAIYCIPDRRICLRCLARGHPAENEIRYIFGRVVERRNLVLFLPFTFQRRGPDWARTSDPALIKRML